MFASISLCAFQEDCITHTGICSSRKRLRPTSLEIISIFMNDNKNIELKYRKIYKSAQTRKCDITFVQLKDCTIFGIPITQCIAVTSNSNWFTVVQILRYQNTQFPLAIDHICLSQGVFTPSLSFSILICLLIFVVQVPPALHSDLNYNFTLHKYLFHSNRNKTNCLLVGIGCGTRQYWQPNQLTK